MKIYEKLAVAATLFFMANIVTATILGPTNFFAQHPTFRNVYAYTLVISCILSTVLCGLAVYVMACNEPERQRRYQRVRKLMSAAVPSRWIH